MIVTWVEQKFKGDDWKKQGVVVKIQRHPRMQDCFEVTVTGRPEPLLMTSVGLDRFGKWVCNG